MYFSAAKRNRSEGLSPKPCQKPEVSGQPVLMYRFAIETSVEPLPLLSIPAKNQIQYTILRRF